MQKYDLYFSHPALFESNEEKMMELLEIEKKRLDELRDYLKEQQGIGSAIQCGGKPVHQYPFGADSVKLPYTESLRNKMLPLHMHTALSSKDVEHVFASVSCFYS